jgi:nickel transport protein
MFLVEFDNGSYSTVDGKTVNVGKREAPSATSSRRPLKWGKTIVVWQSWMTEPVGQRIEVLPVTAAAEPTAGSKFTVRVLFEGKPLAGVMVENNSNETGPKTDADGRATLVLVPGINRLAVDYDLPLKADADADTLALNASLVFMAR